MINWERIDELRADMGPDDFDEVVVLFLEEMDAQIPTIDTENDRSRAEVLHFLKGCAANLGFIELRKICSQAEVDLTFDTTLVCDCYTKSKAQFLSDPKIHACQINTPDNTSSSVMSR